MTTASRHDTPPTTTTFLLSPLPVWTRPFILTLAAVLLPVFSAGLPTFAGLVEVDTVQLGGFYPAGTPDNSFDFQNYFIGHGTTPGFPTTLERRSFFVFELPDLAGPVVSAEISIYLPTPGGIVANFAGGFEEMVLTSTPFGSPEILSDALGDPEIADIFSTFGEGVFFGGVAFADGEVFPDLLTEVVIPLSPDAIAAINASLGSEFIVTGRMTSYDPAPGVLDELMFGLTDVVVGGSPGPIPKPFLSLTTVPEPGSGCLLALACCGLACRRR